MKNTKKLQRSRWVKLKRLTSSFYLRWFSKTYFKDFIKVHGCHRFGALKCKCFSFFFLIKMSTACYKFFILFKMSWMVLMSFLRPEQPWNIDSKRNITSPPFLRQKKRRISITTQFFHLLLSIFISWHMSLKWWFSFHFHFFPPT